MQKDEKRSECLAKQREAYRILKSDPIAYAKYTENAKKYRENYARLYPEKVKAAKDRVALKRIKDREELKAKDPDTFIARLNRTNELRAKWKEENLEEYKRQLQDRRLSQAKLKKENSVEYQENLKKYRFNKVKKHYNLSAEEFQKKIDEQDGVCAICKKPNHTGWNLCIDHDHETNEIRGLLCQNCNRAIGLLRDSSENLQRAVDYLKKYGK